MPCVTNVCLFRYLTSSLTYHSQYSFVILRPYSIFHTPKSYTPKSYTPQPKTFAIIRRIFNMFTYMFLYKYDDFYSSKNLLRNFMPIPTNTQITEYIFAQFEVLLLLIIL